MPLRTRSLMISLTLVGCRAHSTGSALEYFPTPKGEYLLIEPQSTPENLLGRPVVFVDGQLTLGDAPLSTCSVNPRRSASIFSKRYYQEIGSTGHVSVGMMNPATLAADGRRNTIVGMEIMNTEILYADVSGSCGELFVATVKVGKGKRQYLREVGSGANLSGSAKQIHLSAGYHGWKVVEDEISWTEEQAYLISVGSQTDARDFGLRASMPTTLRDQEEFHLKLSAKRETWIVILYRDQNGLAGIVVPTMKHPRSVVPAGETLTLPFPLKATLRTQGIAQREKFTIFGFEDEATFSQFSPPAGNLTNQQALDYAEGLPERLSAVPRRRWTMHEVHYEIVPR